MLFIYEGDAKNMQKKFELKKTNTHEFHVVVFYENSVKKIGVPMPTAKNRFQVLNLHHKIIYFKEYLTSWKIHFGEVIIDSARLFIF